MAPFSAFLPANQIGESTCDASAKDRVSREHGIFVVDPVLRLHILNLGLQNNGDNDTINRNCLAENDAARVERLVEKPSSVEMMSSN